MAKQTKKSAKGGDSENQPAKAAAAAARKAPEAAARRGAGDGESNGGVENLDKVRDILFGSQMRDNERRFGRLEERFSKDTADLRDETRKRLESLETFLRREIQTLTERLKSEQAQRAEAVADIGREIKELGKAFQQRANELAEQTSEIQRDLRQEILDQSKALRDELQAARVETNNEIERAASELRDQKVDRAALADLFSEIAARLTGEE